MPEAECKPIHFLFLLKPGKTDVSEFTARDMVGPHISLTLSLGGPKIL